MQVADDDHHDYNMQVLQFDHFQQRRQRYIEKLVIILFSCKINDQQAVITGWNQSSVELSNK